MRVLGGGERFLTLCLYFSLCLSLSSNVPSCILSAEAPPFLNSTPHPTPHPYLAPPPSCEDFRATSLIRKRLPLGPRPIAVLKGARFLKSETPLYPGRSKGEHIKLVLMSLLRLQTSDLFLG